MALLCLHNQKERQLWRYDYLKFTNKDGFRNFSGTNLSTVYR